MMPENKITKWHNCYDDGWQGLIVPEAFSHPAKMSYGLLKRILSHAKEQGWLKEGQVILDPFGGIGSTGILGAYEDYRVVCVELEERFVKLAQQNFALHRNTWQKLGCPEPLIFQGDSRQLCQIVEKADCIVSSPPFQETLNDAKMKVPHDSSGRFTTDYGQTPGQLGAMKPGKVDMVVSSPPYAESGGTPSLGSVNKDDWGKEGKDICGRRGLTAQYGQTSGNLGNLKSGDVDFVISSPPFEKTDQRGAEHSKRGNYFQRKSGKPFNAGQSMVGYPNSQGQLGQEQGGTFWAAALEIVQQCHQILKPGGHAIWVVKSFVRNKKIVDFPGDWQRLCESVGFKTVCIHHAMLVKEEKHKTLFGHTEVKRKEKKSFFRRLAEAKGSPRIDYEVVLCSRKSS